MKRIYFLKLFCVISFLTMPLSSYVTAQIINDSIDELSDNSDYQEYLDYFENVYSVMEKEYYHPLDRSAFDNFLKMFNAKIYQQLKSEKKSNDYVKWRSAAFLIDALKSSDDIFSAFYPPKPAKEYEEKVLGKRVDLGVDGQLNDVGYSLNFVEPRSDAYQKGLRSKDVIRFIAGEDVLSMDESDVKEKLVPLEGSLTELTYLEQGNIDQRKIIELESREYFKQAVFLMPVKAPNMYGLELQRFNRKTSDDVFRFLEFMRKQGPIKGLIIDLRGNPGGPPLAARELASFFLSGGDDFAYFQKKNQPKSSLDVPKIPEKYKYEGPMVILIDSGSGSAAELFSGIMQKQQRAILMGTNSAGQVFLKSMFTLEDESMMLLVTARGHHPDGEVFSFGGLVPNRSLQESEEIDLVEYATTYLYYINQQQKKDL